MYKSLLTILDKSTDYWRPRFTIKWDTNWGLKIEKWKVYSKNKKYNRRITIGLFGFLFEITDYREE